MAARGSAENAAVPGMGAFRIRAAVAEEVPLILAFLQKKAAFDRTMGTFHGDLQVTLAKLHRTLFGPRPFAWVVWVEFKPAAEGSLADVLTPEQYETVGFALYRFGYSSFRGQPSLWVDDLYLEPGFRSQGAGTLMMRYLADLAKAQDCSHLSWQAAVANTAGLRFYQRLGAKITEQTGDRYGLIWIPEDLAILSQ